MLSSAKCRLAGSGGSTGSGTAVDGVEKQAGGRQLLRGGMGGAVGSPPSSLAMGSGSGGVVGAGSGRKTLRFMGTGRGARRGAGVGGARARSRPARMRRRWPGSNTPMSTRRASLRPWQSVARTSPWCSKSPVYCSRCSACSHSATNSAASPASVMVPTSRALSRPAGLPRTLVLTKAAATLNSSSSWPAVEAVPSEDSTRRPGVQAPP